MLSHAIHNILYRWPTYDAQLFGTEYSDNVQVRILAIDTRTEFIFILRHICKWYNLCGPNSQS